MICNCNRAWCSILPPPPCPEHGRATSYNFFHAEPRRREYTIREERYYVVERGFPSDLLRDSVGSFDTLAEAEAVKAALEALEPRSEEGLGMKAIWHRICDWYMADDDPRMGWGVRAAFARKGLERQTARGKYFEGLVRRMVKPPSNTPRPPPPPAPQPISKDAPTEGKHEH